MALLRQLLAKITFTSPVFIGIRVVGKNKKLESFKFESLKLKRAKRSWKEPIEVGKNRAKLERTERSWKASFEVGKFWLRLASLNELGKL